jgi:hypothetical protein
MTRQKEVVVERLLQVFLVNEGYGWIGAKYRGFWRGWKGNKVVRGVRVWLMKE